ncbi:MAG: molybdopterin-guanine dinucleotide biosynthesis protein A [Actinobacteria bacterium]|nr:molybdopterin-guanine dinucleotide biosynthesis protein A [Actinomycetota bacterium]
MNDPARNDLDSDRWDTWITEACDHLGVDPELVDVPVIHALTKQVAHRYDRPMAPVSAYIVGIALGRALEATPSADVAALLAGLVDEVEATLPGEP